MLRCGLTSICPIMKTESTAPSRLLSLPSWNSRLVRIRLAVKSACRATRAILPPSLAALKDHVNREEEVHFDGAFRSLSFVLHAAGGCRRFLTRSQGVSKAVTYVLSIYVSLNNLGAFVAGPLAGTFASWTFL